MQTLDFRHLAPYLPYGLKVMHTDWNAQLTMTITGSGNNDLSIEDVAEYAKPILRPMSDLIQHRIFSIIGNSYENVSAHANGHIGFYIDDRYEYDVKYYPYEVVEMLLENHFDVFGLIGQSLAININTLNHESCKP